MICTGPVNYFLTDSRDLAFQDIGNSLRKCLQMDNEFSENQLKTIHLFFSEESEFSGRTSNRSDGYLTGISARHSGNMSCLVK